MVSVEIEFIDDNKILTFKRYQKFYKHDDKIEILTPPELEVYTQKDHDIKIKNEDIYIIDRKLPKEIEEYFFFDGAMLGKYFQKTSSEKIKKSIYEISQLNLINEMNDHLQKTVYRYNNRLTEIAPKIGKISSEINDKENKEKKLKKDKNESESIINEAKSHFKEIEDELINKNAADVKQLAKKDKELREKINNLNGSLNNSVKKRKDSILKMYPIILSYNYYMDFLNKTEETKEKGLLPPNIQPSFIKDLLDNNKCICGINLKEHADSEKQLEILLNDTSDIGEESEHIFKIYNQVENSLEKMKMSNIGQIF